MVLCEGAISVRFRTPLRSLPTRGMGYLLARPARLGRLQMLSRRNLGTAAYVYSGRGGHLYSGPAHFGPAQSQPASFGPGYFGPAYFGLRQSQRGPFRRLVLRG